MKSVYRAPIFVFCVAAIAADAGGSLQDVVKRLDQAAAGFQSASSKITRTDHTAVLNEDSTQSGIVYMRKSGKGLQARMDITAPDKKSFAFQGREVQIYYPNMKEVDIYDTGKNGEQLEQFLMLGFGTPGSELERSYSVRMVGSETVNGEKAAHLELLPKSGEARKMVKQIDLWIGDRNYPVQEKILQPSGDYSLITYSDVQLNPPNLTEQNVQLKLPSGVKKVYPQR